MAKPKQSALAGWLDSARQFLVELPAEGVWVRPVAKKLHRAVHFALLVWRGFSGNRCPVRAAALSYTTLLALVPVLAVAFWFSKNFLQDRSSEVVPKVLNKLISEVAPQLQFLPAQGAETTTGQVVVSSQGQQQAVAMIQSFIGNIDAGTLGTIGTVALILVAVRLLMTIEQTFNDIWGVPKGRPIWRKIVYYWATITLGPLLVVVAVYMTGKAELFTAFNRFMPGVERFVFKLAPFLVLWIGFSLLYMLMPNTSVRPRAALIGGIVGGTLWQLNNLLNTLYVSRVVTYSKIYGAIGIIPVFLAGLYFSWLIVLFGAQVSYAAQNFRVYLLQRAGERIDQRGRELIACRAMLIVSHHFLHGLKPPGVEEIAEQMSVSAHWLNRLVHRLIQGGLLSEVADDQSGLVPARPPEAITLTDVLHVMRTGDQPGTGLGNTFGNAPVERLLGKLHAAAQASPANMAISELVGSVDAPPPQTTE